MSLLTTISKVFEESKREYEKRKEEAGQSPCFTVTEIDNLETDNLLARGDNCDFMEYLLKTRGLAGKLQLIYLDPPFYTKANYEAVLQLRSNKIGREETIKIPAYDDRWNGGIEEYLRMLCLRLFLMRDLLSDTGCLWIHLDWHVTHYVKILMDAIFGEENFINEIIWNYKSGGTGKRSFSRKHDTLLFYSKSSSYYFQPLKEKSYNRNLKPYRFKGVEEYQDKTGWYTMVNMKDVWQIDMVGRTSGERNGYATQKPEALLERIVESCSKEGELCADFFGGSATLAAVAQKKGRKWISCDASGIAISAGIKRLLTLESSFVFLQGGSQRVSEGLQLRMEIEPTESPENLKLIFTLIGYTIEEKGLPPGEKNRKEAKHFEEQDSLQLLQYWSVDFHYNGRVHKREVFLVNDKGIKTVCCGQAQAGGRVSVRAMDVFGNITQKMIEIRESNEENHSVVERILS